MKITVRGDLDNARIQRFQLKAALEGMGHYAVVNQLFTDPRTRVVRKLAWSEGHSFSRDSDTIKEIATELGWGPADIDALFIAAVKIQP